MAKSKNGLTIDLNEVTDLQFALSSLGDNFIDKAAEVAGIWAHRTEGRYRSKISYGNGFHNINPRYRNLTAYSDSEKKDSGFKAEIGHECFIARFLEVGTKPHEIREGHRVGGIKGTKVLKKTIDEELPALTADLEEIVDEALK